MMTNEEIKQEVRDEIKDELIKHMIVSESIYCMTITSDEWHKIFKTKEVES